MVLPNMALWGKKKGIDILTTADWTHPLWFREISQQLEEKAEGLYKIKNQNAKVKNTDQKSKIEDRDVHFILSTEVSSIYNQGGKLRRIHNLIFAPNIETAEKVNKELQKRGVNLMSDGRPIMGISAKNLLELLLSIDRKIMLIPCHAWTPWFSIYGSNSGFDSIEECFGDYAKYIYGVETGLSSDPEMNWRIKDLENRSILSFSDSHSLPKMGREATVFEMPQASYSNIGKAIVEPMRRSKSSESSKSSTGSNEPHIAYTLEFYPEEGKYHYNGHRNCNVVLTPQETKEKGVICPVCKRPITVGVMQRVQELAAQQLTVNTSTSLSAGNSQLTVDEYGVKWIHDSTGKHPPFVKLVPLIEIVAESMEATVASQKVKTQFDQLCEAFGSEINVLLKTSIDKIATIGNARIAEGIERVRKGTISVSPGFDGEYGKVKIWDGQDAKAEEIKDKSTVSTDQLGLEF